MKGSNSQRRLVHSILLGLTMSVAVGVTGCLVDVGGQTHPSPYYMTDDVQYFPHGAEMKLSREAAALKAAAQEQQQAPRR